MTTPQTKCGRTACASTHLTHWNSEMQRYYCPACAKKINEYNPGLCVLDEAKIAELKRSRSTS